MKPQDKNPLLAKSLIKAISLIFIFSFAAPKKVAAQSGEQIAAVAGAAVAIGAAAFAIHQVIELWELEATQYMLENRPGASEFSLKLNKPFSASTKWSDVSSISLLSFNVNYSRVDNDTSSEREVLLMFLDDGYMTEYGLDVTRVSWEFVNASEWNSILAAYLNLATGLDIIANSRAYIYEDLRSGQVDPLNSNHKSVSGRDTEVDYYEKTNKYVSLYRGLRVGEFSITAGHKAAPNASGIEVARLLKISGDTYLVNDYSEDFKIIYNEKSLGLYLKESRRLVQLNTSVVNSITDFIN
jgi:hypothetical protein